MTKFTSTAPATPQTSQELQDLLNERAEKFAKDFAHAAYEMGEAQNFVRELCGVYGLN